MLNNINYTGGQVTFPSAIYVPLIPEAGRLHRIWTFWGFEPIFLSHSARSSDPITTELSQLLCEICFPLSVTIVLVTHLGSQWFSSCYDVTDSEADGCTCISYKFHIRLISSSIIVNRFGAREKWR